MYFIHAYVAPTERLKKLVSAAQLGFTSTPEFSHMGFYNKSIIIIGTGETAYYYKFQMYLIIRSCFQ